MKNCVITLLILLSVSACTSKRKIEFDQKKPLGKTDAPKIVFDEPKYDFGEIKEGDVVSHTYTFKNEGTLPLEILAVNVSCGCTVAEKPEKPVGVGQKGQIKVTFNSSGKAGVNTKNVIVLSNASNSTENVSFDVVVNSENK